MEEKSYCNICKALSDSNRMMIFNLLRKNTMCAFEILEHLQCSQPTLSYHMKQLCDCGLVDATKKGLWVHYSVNEKCLKEFSEYFASKSE